MPIYQKAVEFGVTDSEVIIEISPKCNLIYVLFRILHKKEINIQQADNAELLRAWIQDLVKSLGQDNLIHFFKRFGQGNILR